MQHNKKGILFTSLSILVLLLFLAISAGQSVKEWQNGQFSITHRLQSMNSFIDNLEDDLEIAVFTSGFRAIITILEDIRLSGSYDSNVKSTLEELMIDGSNSTFMSNNTLTDWANRMIERAEVIGIDLDITISDIDIYHTDPFILTIQSTMIFNISDERNLASWNFESIQTADIPIQGFEDPVFIVETNNLYPRVINKSIYEGNFVVSSDASNLITHMQEGLYIASPAAPSYLNRLEGDFSADENGIESLVDKAELSGGLVIDVSASNVDHIYFSSALSSFQFTITPAEFYLDNETVILASNTTRISQYQLETFVIP